MTKKEVGKKIGDPMTKTGKVTEELMKWQYLWRERGSSSSRADVCWNDWNQSARPVQGAGPAPTRQHQTGPVCLPGCHHWKTQNHEIWSACSIIPSHHYLKHQYDGGTQKKSNPKTRILNIPRKLLSWCPKLDYKLCKVATAKCDFLFSEQVNSEEKASLSPQSGSPFTQRVWSSQGNLCIFLGGTFLFQIIFFFRFLLPVYSIVSVFRWLNFLPLCVFLLRYFVFNIWVAPCGLETHVAVMLLPRQDTENNNKAFRFRLLRCFEVFLVDVELC